MSTGTISWESIRQWQVLHKAFLGTPKINDYSYSKSDLTCCTYQMRATIFHYSTGSWCPLPRRAKVTTANVIATPIAAPYAATDASAMNVFRDNTKKINGNNTIITNNQVCLVIIAIKNSSKYDFDVTAYGS